MRKTNRCGLDRRTLLAGGVAGPVALAAAAGAEPAKSAPAGKGDRITRATTTSGPIRGYVDGGIHTFKGVPYGASTAGEGRFRAPRRPAPWATLRDATQYGPYAPQLPLPSRMTVEQAGSQSFLGANAGLMGIPALAPDQSEDCLVLNVWTPGLDVGAKRAVMVRIHGGGFFVGSGSWSWHDGANLARRGDVVVVTVNHRLGPLGYLYLGDSMGPDYVANAGMLDLILALEWVRDNIAGFGGNPANVTIFGESGGGAKIATLMAMPAAQGLFKRAILQSGVALAAQSRAQAADAGRAALEKLGVAPGDKEKLSHLPVEAIFDACNAAALSPSIDAASLPVAPGEALAAGTSREVPIIVGTTLTEGASMHTSELPQIAKMTDAQLRSAVAEPFGTAVADRLIARYRKAHPLASPGDLFLLIEAAVMMRRNSWRFAEAKARGGASPIYTYLLEWKSGAVGGLLGAAHGICVPLTMDNVERSGPWTADYPESQVVADAMSEAWIAFAKTGNPNVSGRPTWPAYESKRKATMAFDVASRAVDDPYGEQAIWADIPQTDRLLLKVPGAAPSAMDAVLKTRSPR